MNERQELFFKELRELLQRHNAEIANDVRTRSYYTEDVAVVHFNGSAENGWAYDTVDLFAKL